VPRGCARGEEKEAGMGRERRGGGEGGNEITADSCAYLSMMEAAPINSGVGPWIDGQTNRLLAGTVEDRSRLSREVRPPLC
jgi:hypothetical protein